jgi:ribosomal protein S18 acetylase RimI-like enzyme
MLITQATVGDLPVVLGLIDEASKWLRSKGTDQWARAWPSEPERDMRVLTGLRNGKTWIVWDGDVAAATVTIANSRNPDVWKESGATCDLSEKAVYVHRLIIARKYAGRGLGAELINWAGLRGKRKNRAKWIRIDVWTSNLALHAFYRSIGFADCGTCPDPYYPSGALFQKPTSMIEQPSRPQFTEHADLVARNADRELAGAGRSAA